MHKLIRAIAFGALLCASPAAFAQALPDSVRAAGVTVAQWEAVQREVRRAAAARGASERALAAVAQRVSANLVVNGQIDLDQVLSSIDERAQQVVELQTQLTAMQQADDPAVAALLSQARAAIEAGDLTGGDQLLAQAAESDLAGIARDRARLAARQTRAGQTFAERGRLAYASADYLAAAAHYGRAAETATPTDPMLWRYRLLQAFSLRERGGQFVEPAHLREAVRIYRDLALPLAPRATRTEEWAETQRQLANALASLGGFGDDAALRESVAAYRATLEVYTRESSPETWARRQMNLAGVLRELGARGDPAALTEAVAAFRAVLDARTRDAEPDIWADAQFGLGMTLTILGRRAERGALQGAIAAFRAASEVYTRDADPDAWSTVQAELANALVYSQDEADAREAVAIYRVLADQVQRAERPYQWAARRLNLGTALAGLGSRTNDDAMSREAIVAFRAAMEVLTRDAAPARWASAQSNVGIVLRGFGERGDRSAMREAIAAFQSVLDVQTDAPAAWANTQLNLAQCYYYLGVVRGDRSQIPLALAAARSAHEAFERAGNRDGYQQAAGMIFNLERESAAE